MFASLCKVAVPSLLVSLTVLGVLSPAGLSRLPKEKTLRHVVLFKFKDTATPGQVKEVEDAFRALPSKISVIKGFEWGTNVSPENLNQGFTHCFFLTFSSAADRDAYLVHPAHKEFGKLLGPYLDKVTVVDFWSQD
jgi:hypothetical protein